MKKIRATEDTLGELHKLVAQALTDKINNGDATPADINAAIKFLQNNGIEAIATDESPLGKLVDSLPTFDDEDEHIH
jgi:hypothetical protein